VTTPTYMTVTGADLLALLALWAWVPRTDALRGGPVMQKLGALRSPAIWAIMTVAALGVASIIAVYTLIGSFRDRGRSLKANDDSGRARPVRHRHDGGQPDRRPTRGHVWARGGSSSGSGPRWPSSACSSSRVT
jgi:hypothetical protein